MVSLQPLAAVGYTPAFFHLGTDPQDTASPPEYYIFDTQSPILEQWDVIGLRWYRGTSRFVAVQLMHFDQEMLEWPPFEGERDSPGYISLNPAELLALIAFFEALVPLFGATRESPGGPPRHFRVLASTELVTLHLTAQQVAHAGTDWREYEPEHALRRGDERTVLKLPNWSPAYPASQSTLLACTTFERAWLTDPSFHPLDAEGLGTIRLDGTAMRELIALLQGRVYSGHMSGPGDL